MRTPYRIFTQICLIVFLAPFVASCQDTLWVQGFNYASKTRDSLLDFKSNDHSDFEKILMYYSMRCKGAQISTGTDRNKGCGEWDYSCNTNIIDSSGVDSTRAVFPNYVISGLTDDWFFFRNNPTYTYYEYEQTNVNVQNANNVTYFNIGNPQNTTILDLKSMPSSKVYYLFPNTDLNGLTTGQIQGVQWKHGGTGRLKYLKIKLATTEASQLSKALIDGLTFQEVVDRNVTINGGDKTDIYFHKPFLYQNNNNLVLEISYTGNEADLGNIQLQASPNNVDFKAYSQAKTDRYLALKDQGSLALPKEVLTKVSNQISITFWTRGIKEAPLKQNSIFYAEDKQKNRQLNVHLPWSDSRIYWDCGSDGNGFDRIDKLATGSEIAGGWNHWTFTKNVALGTMKIYLNGVLWHSGNNKIKPINLEKMTLFTNLENALAYVGDIDDFGLWNKELSPNEIKTLMFESPNSSWPHYPNMLLYFDMDETSGFNLLDQSSGQQTTTLETPPLRRTFRGEDVFKAFVQASSIPDMAFIKGNINVTTTKEVSRDSIVNPSNKVTPYTIVGGTLTPGDPYFVWEAGQFPVFNEAGQVIGDVTFLEEDALEIEPLIYYKKSVAKFELLSFVTPYGIGLDLGENGKTWIFDVTDFGPILKGKKRLLMDKGGEWQEEIDIKFAFIKGKPTRNVLGIQQIWPADAYGYSAILGEQQLEPRTLLTNDVVKGMKVKVVTTGHGQEGEFIPRTHSININEGPAEYSWQLWKECADNPIYPQGGTWVYDRAGWCPGAPSDLREFDITPLVGNNTSFTIDYDLNTASGDSRYIVNAQLVKYGAPNFTQDAAIDEIISPSTQAIFGRLNPICANPSIVLKNNGSNTLTSVRISYGVEGSPLQDYIWTGSLDFLKKQTVVLPSLDINNFYNGGRFIVQIKQVNDGEDQHKANNTLTSEITKTNIVKDGLIIHMKTNAMPNETKWTLKDQDGNIIRTSKPALQAFTLYQDTVYNLNGCYQLQFTDTDEDGISWWANGDGAGFIRAKGIDGAWNFFQPDFGKELTFRFVAGLINHTVETETEKTVVVYPNPCIEEAILDLKGFSGPTRFEVWSQSGQLLTSEYISNPNPEWYQTTVDLERQPVGIYYIRVVNNKTIKTIKLVKM